MHGKVLRRSSIIAGSRSCIAFIVTGYETESARTRGFLLAHEHDVAIANNNGGRLKIFIEARPPNAQTVLNTEQGAMQGALNHRAVQTEKFVFYPVERGAGVRARIAIGENSGVLPYQADREVGAILQVNLFAAAVLYVVDAAQDAFFWLVAAELSGR